MSVNSYIPQGYLNRAIPHIVVPAYPQLAVIAPFMGKSMAVLTFDEPAVDQPGTATSIVTSPRTYVMGKLVVNLLRSQPLANLWLAQWQTQAYLGDVTVYSDSVLLSSITLSTASLTDLDTGAFDGQDPAFKVTISGVYYVNATMWTGAI